jgi:ankyrin repeat protein
MEKKLQATEKQPVASTLPSALERQRRSEFMVACASGDLDKVEQMLADGADPNYLNDLGGTPLTWAVAWERQEVVECLLRNGAEVELPARPARSPLMHAASRGNEAIVAILMAHGADPSRKDKDGQLPVDLAKGTGRADCAVLIEQLAKLIAKPIRCASMPTSIRYGHCHGGYRRQRQ